MPVPLTDIYSDLGAFGRDSDNYLTPDIRLQKLDTMPSPSLEAIMFKGEMTSEKTPKSYLVNVQFFDVEFSGTKVKDFNGVDKAGGKPVYYKLPALWENPVQVRCSCSDFRFRFEWWLAKEGGLIGEPTPYTPVKPDSGRPPVNPKKVMGLCKHLHNFIETLVHQKRITD